MKEVFAMPVSQTTVLICLGAAVLMAALRVFRAPIRLLFRFLSGTVLGLAVLFVLQLAGAPFGLTLGLNLINAAVIGVLGLPGLALLLILVCL